MFTKFGSNINVNNRTFSLTLICYRITKVCATTEDEMRLGETKIFYKNCAVVFEK